MPSCLCHSALYITLFSSVMYHDVHSLGNNRNVIKFVQIINNLFLSGCCFNSNKTPALGLDVFQEYLVTHFKSV